MRTPDGDHKALALVVLRHEVRQSIEAGAKRCVENVRGVDAGEPAEGEENAITMGFGCT